MESHLPLHICNKKIFNLFIIIIRSHAFIHSTAIAFLIYYRLSFLFQHPITTAKPAITISWFLVFFSEFFLFFIWLIGLGFRWRPVSRTVFPERLPEDKKLPGIDVFICTADPNKEPTFDVMNTVLSAMALDYPPDKLHIYLSDDAGADITLHGMKQAWKFAKWWLPFCRKYGIKTRCPKAYFSGAHDDIGLDDSAVEFRADRDLIKTKYEELMQRTMGTRGNGWLEELHMGDTRSHSANVQVINEIEEEEHHEMPQLIYVSREKSPSRPHNFKAGALNVLLRVSGIMSNSAYILILDCDMYSNDATSAKQAMCFHLDPKFSSSLALVQFPQLFHNTCKSDIYDSRVRSIFQLYWHGMDGLQGPMLSGTNFYLKREALYDGVNVQNGENFEQLKNCFGESNELIKSLKLGPEFSNMTSNGDYSSLLQEARILASCAYENDTKWGNQVGFRYGSVVEDFFTGFILFCKGWRSVYLNPSRPQFLGSSTTNLNDVLIQSSRWNAGLVGVGLSKFCPLTYEPSSEISLLQRLCFAQGALSPLFQSFSLWCFATIPQLCLLCGIPLYPEVSDPFFFIFLFIFTSAIAQNIFEVLNSKGSKENVINEQRIWMMKAVTSNTYGSLDAILKTLGVRESSFLPTNKVEDDDQVKLYQMGIFDFQTSTRLLAPLVTLAILNMASFFVGIVRIVIAGGFHKYLLQVLLSFYILAVNYPVIEGMVIRKDKGRIPPSATLVSAIFALILVGLGSIVLMY